MIKGQRSPASGALLASLGHSSEGKSGLCERGNTGCLELYLLAGAIARSLLRQATMSRDFLNPAHVQDVDEWLENLTLGMVTAITILDPSLVIVGAGGQHGRLSFEKLDRVRSRLRHPLVAKQLVVRRSPLAPLADA